MRFLKGVFISYMKLAYFLYYQLLLILIEDIVRSIYKKKRNLR